MAIACFRLLTLPPLPPGPLFAVPIGLAPLYLAALLAFVRTPDGRHWEALIVDRYRFSRMSKLAVNLSEGVRLERSNKIINLREEVIPIVDTTIDTEPIRRTLHEIDLPVTIGPYAGVSLGEAMANMLEHQRQHLSDLKEALAG